MLRKLFVGAIAQSLLDIVASLASFITFIFATRVESGVDIVGVRSVLSIFVAATRFLRPAEHISNSMSFLISANSHLVTSLIVWQIVYLEASISDIAKAQITAVLNCQPRQSS